MRTFILSLMFCLSMSGCGKDAIAVDAPTPPAPVDPSEPTLAPKVILAVFSAPWCGYCGPKLKEVQGQLNRLTAHERSLIDFRVYVVTGNDRNNPPSDTESIAYRNKLGISASAYSDPWRWSTFKKWLPKESFGIPAGVVLDHKENVLKRYSPGRVDAIDIVEFAVLEALKK